MKTYAEIKSTFKKAHLEGDWFTAQEAFKAICTLIDEAIEETLKEKHLSGFDQDDIDSTPLPYKRIKDA